ncbi:MAG TPA: hypothetical protein VIS48_06725 [Candidatus Kryptonia bacterium]
MLKVSDQPPIMKCISIPRGVSLVAGGIVEPDAKHFKLTAHEGSSIFGIGCNPFLNGEFKTVAFELEMSFHDDQSLSYYQVTMMEIKGQEALFEHIDRNRLKRV